MLNDKQDRVLFRSVSAALLALEKKLITDEQLDDGLFLLDEQQRTILLEPADKPTKEPLDRFLRNFEKKNPDLINRFAGALRKAEEDGRSTTIRPGQNSFRLLNELLDVSGFGQIEKLSGRAQLHDIMPGLIILTYQWVRNQEAEQERRNPPGSQN